MLNQRPNFFGRRCAALSEISDFRRHHGEATTMLTGTCSLDRRIQRQNISLESNPFYNAGDFLYLQGVSRDILHRFAHFAHGRLTFTCQCFRLSC